MRRYLSLVVRKLGVLMGALVTLAFAPAAEADIPDALGITCSASAENANVRLCSGQTETFDGTGIDVNVVFPPAGQGDGPFPMIGVFHGWGGSKVGLEADADDERPQAWAERGYAVFSMSDRGWGGSCGAQDFPDRLDPAVCGAGYNHLMDTRYEVRDAQFLIGRLADENRVIPDKVGVTGGSYGGGLSMALAALKNRTMMPDGSLAPWTSPGPDKKPMSIAAAAPDIPWTDLAYSLLPHGRTLDYAADSQYFGPNDDYPIGIPKQSYIGVLYSTGQALSNYAPPGTDPSADLATWFALINAGDPIDQTSLATDIADEVTTYHSSYYIPIRDENGNPAPPAPLLISNGWTDDLFPVDEAIRFYNRTRDVFGTDQPISLIFTDTGHARGQNKSADQAMLRAARDAWFDHYLKGTASAPEQGVTALTQTCPGDAPSAGPFTAADWDSLSPGEVRFADTGSKTITPGGGNPSDGVAYDPAGGNLPGAGDVLGALGGAACSTTSGPDRPGTATYTPRTRKEWRLHPARLADGDRRHLHGLAELPGRRPAAGRQPRGRPHARRARPLPARRRGPPGLPAPPERVEVRGRPSPKLELLPADQPYGRNSNAQAPVTVANLELRLPVREKIGEPAAERPARGDRPGAGRTGRRRLRDRSGREGHEAQGPDQGHRRR